MLASGSTPGGVFQFVQTDDIGIQTGKRGEEFVALAGEFQRLVGIRAAAFEVLHWPPHVIQDRYHWW